MIVGFVDLWGSLGLALMDYCDDSQAVDGMKRCFLTTCRPYCGECSRAHRRMLHACMCDCAFDVPSQ